MMLSLKIYFRNILKISDDRRFQIKRDLSNLVKYGFGAPRYAERIWINPKVVKKCIIPKGLSLRKTSGLVMDISGLKKVDLLECRQVQSCYDHWCAGIAWKDTLSYKMALMDLKNGKTVADCKTENDLKDRLNKLDILYEHVKVEGRLKTRKEISPSCIRESGGIQVSIDRKGNLMLNQGGGFHRFSIALLLGLEKIPAQIGIVEKEAIPLFVKYRK